MHLSSITIKGFKSFPERTKLVFSPGVSVIVGPNGSGKSNITDAVLWALGEQSPLTVRGQSMRDMIYAGGQGRGPSRSAEIEVVLGDVDGDETATGFSEIAIRRRLDRDGEGAYWINGARARLTDVVELLGDANLGREMHSVISQGRVEEIVNSRPRERRSLVEEAAGLGKHRKRRRRTQLKLERTQENLDRALDVEREARSRLRPLKRQAQAADIHARLERDAAELRARLVASELSSHSGGLDSAERAASQARESRDAIEAEIAAVNARRTQIEERLAERDRERTEAWGRLTAIRAAHERLTVRAEALARRRTELATELEARRAALGSLADETGGAGADPVDTMFRAIGNSLTRATDALTRARESGKDEEQASEIAAVRTASQRAATAADRAQELIAERRQGSLEAPVAAAERTLTEFDALIAAVAAARDATGERATTLETRTVGEGGGDDVTAALRACSAEESELQLRLRGIAESVTESEVRASQLRDRRKEATEELERLGRILGRELEATGPVIEDAEREEIERGLERLGRRREQLGPVNPLAEREYEEALTHVSELTEQREDLEKALAELAGLIAETDRKIDSAFHETFDAAQKNFEDLVSHMFPGGRGRLRLVDENTPKAVLGGAEKSNDDGSEEAGFGIAAASSAADTHVPAAEGEGMGGDGSDDDGPSGVGVEIEVTPAGKAMRRLSLLSGGEKALVALAFVFAVFLARPSPFYILDEVEAALDDANIDRFLQLVRRFSGRAQFVIVTHQKRTMDAADVLYGVSMGEGGITKVISRRMPGQDEPTLEEAESAEAA
jgi:chromosome segregation ATPase